MNELDKKIYEIFARKELSEGCKVKAIMFGRDEYFTCIGMRKITEGVGIYQYDKFEQDGVPIEIIGHEPTITDVFRVAKEKGLFPLVQTEDFNNYYIGIAGENTPYREIPYNPTLSLLEQADETKESIIKLFEN